MRCLQEICTYYGMEVRCAPVDWQSTITVCNWAAENCPKLQVNKPGNTQQVKFVQRYSNHQVLKSNTRPLNGGAGRVQKW